MLTRFRILGAVAGIGLLAQSAALADPVTDLLSQTGLNSLINGSATGGGIEVDVLNPTGTGDNDILGLDLFTPENGLGLSLAGTEILGFGNPTGGTAIPLDFLGLDQLTKMLGLAPNSALVDALRNTVGPDGAVIVPIVDSLQALSGLGDAINFNFSDAIGLPGLSDQPIGLAIAGAENSGNATADGIAGVALLTPGASGNGGLVGLAVISGNNSGNGQLVGVSVLGGNNTGNGDLAGIAVLGGDQAGNSQTLALSALSGSNAGNAGVAGIGVLNDDNSGNGGTAGVAALNGNNAGNGGLAGVGALNGDNAGNGGLAGVGAINDNNSGNGGTAGVGVLSGDGSGNADAAGVSVISGDSSGNGDVGAIAVLSGDNSGNGAGIAGGVISGDNSGNGGAGSIGIGGDDNGDGSDGTDGGGNCEGIACGDDGNPAGDGELLAASSECSEGDADGDGVCDEVDDCKDTPADTAVFSSGCHLDENTSLVLRGVNFVFNTTDVTEASKPLLEEARSIIREYPNALISIDGHTDAKGSESYNEDLSYRRARSVYQYFLENDIAAERLTFRGFGESVPIAANTTESGADYPEGRALNRRVELSVLDRASFDAIKKDNAARIAAREEAARQAKAEEARRQQQAREKAARAAEEKEKTQAAESDYEDVLNFLEETGAADTSGETSPATPSESADNSTADEDYTLEVIEREEI